MEDIKRILVIGTSMGGFKALENVLNHLHPDLPISIFIVQHIVDNSNPQLPYLLSKRTSYEVKLAEHDEKIRPGVIYTNPSDQHVLIESDRIFLSYGPRENGSRPSINNLFRSAAINHHQMVIGVLLTGLLSDGTDGLKTIKDMGGTAIVQDPDEAEYKDMPHSALQKIDNIDYIAALEDIGPLVRVLVKKELTLQKYKAKREAMLKLKVAHAGDVETMLPEDDSIFMKMDNSSSIGIIDSLYSILQQLQERTNMLENLFESEIIKGNEQMAKLYYNRANEMRTHTKNLKIHLDQQIEKAS